MTPFNRKLLYAILLYTCVEGLVVNVTFPSKLGYVAKDAALVLSYLILLGNNDGRGFGSLQRFSGALVFFGGVQAFYLLLPNELPLMAKLVGLKMRLLYVPAMFVAYRFVRAPEDWNRLSLVLVLSAVPVSLFGLYLYAGGPAALRAIGGSYAAVVTTTTGVWRVPGTFNSPGQFGLYLTFNALLAVGLLLTPGLTRRWAMVIWTCLALITIAMLASGSRSPLILMLACAGAAMLALGRVGRIVSMAIGVYIMFAIGFATLGAGVEERVGSIASMEHVARFNRTYFGQLFISKMMETPMGLGLGVATIGARHFTEFGQVILVESYFGLIAIETGVIGLLAILTLSAAVVLYLARARLLMKTGQAAAVWHTLAAFVVTVIMLGPVSTPLDSAPGNLYFWLTLGALARLYDLERARREAELVPPVSLPYA